MLPTVFSGYQLQFAMQQQKQHNTAATFNAVEYALGFGAHVVGDAAGFYPGGCVVERWCYGATSNTMLTRALSLSPKQLLGLWSCANQCGACQLGLCVA